MGLKLENSRAVIVGCARNAEAHLPSALAAAAGIGRHFSDCAFVFVENDSSDSTPKLLARWARFRRQAHILRLGALALAHPKRTDRLAIARNAYLDFIRRSRYSNFDYLIVIDLDDVWQHPLENAALTSSLRHLDGNPDVAAIFANAFPLYYDVWALRHPVWSPDDCWARVDQSDHRRDAVARHVRTRQVYVPSDAAPISVDSAFGGLGIYRMSAALRSRYVGLDVDSREVCEHVAFNAGVGAHGVLQIFPPLQLQAPTEHLDPDVLRSLGATKEMSVVVGRSKRTILAPKDHPLDRYQKAHPLYDRRLAEFSAILTQHAQGTIVVDIGANIGDTAALMREAGCHLKILCIEPSTQYFSYLTANAGGSWPQITNVESLQAFIGNPSDSMELVEHDGTAYAQSTKPITSEYTTSEAITVKQLSDIVSQPVSLVKIDTDGLDARILQGNRDFFISSQPVLWSEMDTTAGASLEDWRSVFDDLQHTHQYVVAFDNFGFLIAHGPTAELKDTLLTLFSYCQRRKQPQFESLGPPPVYYIDVVLVPERWRDAMAAFLHALPEFTDSKTNDPPSFTQQTYASS